MAKIDWIEQRLLEWARWKAMGGGGVLGFAGVRLGEVEPKTLDPYGAQAPIPTSNINASATDDAVKLLPGELRITVIAHYLEGHRTEAQKLVRLCVSKAGFHARIDKAQRMLADHFLAKQERAKAERARVEALRAGARP